MQKPTIVCWNKDKANALAARLIAEGETVIMTRMMRAGFWAYSVKRA